MRWGWVVPAGWLLGIGWYFAICVILGVVIGRWLDDWVGTSPLFTLIGTFLGLAAALYGGYRMLTERLLGTDGRRTGPGGKP
jgi:ATP synthase protein I